MIDAILDGSIKAMYIKGEDTITSIVEAFKKYEPAVHEGQKPAADLAIIRDLGFEIEGDPGEGGVDYSQLYAAETGADSEFSVQLNKRPVHEAINP